MPRDMGTVLDDTAQPWGSGAARGARLAARGGAAQAMVELRLRPSLCGQRRLATVGGGRPSAAGHRQPVLAPGVADPRRAVPATAPRLASRFVRRRCDVAFDGCVHCRSRLRLNVSDISHRRPCPSLRNSFYLHIRPGPGSLGGCGLFFAALTMKGRSESPVCAPGIVRTVHAPPPAALAVPRIIPRTIHRYSFSTGPPCP